MRQSRIRLPESSIGTDFEKRVIQFILYRDETSARRWTLLRLPVVFCHPKPLQLEGRTDQRDLWIYQDIAADA